MRKGTQKSKKVFELGSPISVSMSIYVHPCTNDNDDYDYNVIAFSIVDYNHELRIMDEDITEYYNIDNVHKNNGNRHNNYTFANNGIDIENAYYENVDVDINSKQYLHWL